MKKIVAVLTLFFALSVQGIAQEKIPISERDYSNQQIEMADRLRADGKIWVVVGTIGIVVGGIFLYLFLLEKKIGRIEKSVESENKQLQK